MVIINNKGYFRWKNIKFKLLYYGTSPFFFILKFPFFRDHTKFKIFTQNPLQSFSFESFENHDIIINSIKQYEIVIINTNKTKPYLVKFFNKLLTSRIYNILKLFNKMQ